LLGYAANQIALHAKLVHFSTNKTPDDPIEQRVSGAQSQILARLAIGVLSETWILIQKRFLGSTIGKDLEPKLSELGRVSLVQLKKHFGQSGLLTKLRNNFAFHHPTDEDVEAGFNAAAADADWNSDWNWYVTTSTLNTFYFMSDVVILHAILHAAGEHDLIAAQKRIMGEVSKVSGLLIHFIFAVTEAFLVKHFGANMQAVVAAKLDSAPGIDVPWIPFYVEVPDEALPVEPSAVQTS